MVLRNGVDGHAHIEKLAAVEQVPSASIVGIGFMREATFGFYDFSKNVGMDASCKRTSTCGKDLRKWAKAGGSNGSAAAVEIAMDTTPFVPSRICSSSLVARSISK